MHATIIPSASISRVLQYHELKVRKGQAELLDGDNFMKATSELSYHDKLYHFERLMSLNDSTEKKVLHVFLRFHQADKVSNDQMRQIAREYVTGMGFGNQPWLVYRHHDSLHAHAHLVSTRIRPDGKRIALSQKDLRHSRELTHALERKFGLDQANSESTLKEKARVQKVKYGEASLFPTMNKVLEAVVPQFAYTSLADFNAVLSLYNLKASRGKTDSITFQKKGLIYLPLGENGKEQGAYIKASIFPSKPTLANVAKRFSLNEGLREPHRRRLTSTIDYQLAGGQLSITAFRQAMARERISVVVQQDKNELQNIWYVDQVTKTVFEGTALGVRYTAAAIQQRTLSEETYRQRQQVREETQRAGHSVRHSL